MANVGYATLQVIPSMQGMGQALTSGVAGPADQAGRVAGGKFTSSFGGAIKGLAATVGAAFVGTQIVGFFKDSVAGASDLNETLNKSNVIFGTNAASIERWASTAATNLGLSKGAALDAAAGFGDMFAQLGFGGEQAAALSTSTVQLAADLGSFNNLPTEDVAQRISAAFRGEYDSLQLLIPNINAARVQSEALAMTGKTVAAELTAQEKAAAVLAIVNADGARAQGDFARTSDALANSQKILTARWADAKATVGQALLPVMITLTAFLSNTVVPTFVSVAEKVTAFIQSADFSGIKSGVDALTAGFSSLGPALTDGSAGFPDFTKILNLTGRVLAFAGDHVDLVVKALPFLAAGFILVKTAQLAANAAAALTPALRVAEILVNRKLIASNKQLALAIRSQTITTRGAAVAEITNTTAKSGGVFASLRSAAATIMKTTAELAAAAATKAVAAAQWLMNAAMAANPIMLVVVAIAALAAGLVYAYKNSETFRDIVDGVWKAVSGFIKGAWENVIKPVIGALVAAFAWVVTTAQALGAAVAAVWTGVKQTTSAAWEWVKTTIGGALAALWTAITTKFGEIKTAISTAWEGIKTLVGLAIDAVKEKISAVLTAIRVAWSIAWNAVKSFLSGIWEGIKSIAGNAIDIVLGWISGLLGRIEDVKDALFGIGGGIGGGLLGGGGVTGGFGGDAVGAEGGRSGGGSTASGGVNLNVTKYYAGRISAFEEAQEDSRDIAWARALA